MSCVHSSSCARGYLAEGCPSSRRAGLACANTSSSQRLRVSPRKASCSNTMGKVAWSSIGCGQSLTGSKYSTAAGCCSSRRPQKAKATGLDGSGRVDKQCKSSDVSSGGTSALSLTVTFLCQGTIVSCSCPLVSPTLLRCNA